MLFGVQPNEINILWPVVAPMLQRAIDCSPRDYKIEDLHAELQKTSMQLWVWDTGNGVEACCITTITNYPQRSVCDLPFIAGGKMRDWLSMESTISAWAKTKGCSQLGGCGRTGWLKVLRHWKNIGVKIRRDI